MAKNHYSRAEKEEYEKIEKTCKFCGEKFYKVWSKYSLSEFCSQSCSRKYSSRLKRKEVNKKISDSLKNYYKTNNRPISVIKKEEYYQNPNKCCICGKVIEYKSRKNKTCSRKCNSKCANLTKQKNGTVFVENGQPRSKSGHYKGFYCSSTYELVYYIYMTEHGHEVIRNTKTYDYMFDGKNKIYIPDFRVDGKLVEIKGYNSRQVKAKIESVKDEDIKILYYKDLSDMMDYVDKKYGTKHTPYSNNYFILYDEDKPEKSFEYTCDICGKKFKSKWKRNKKINFTVCSMDCKLKIRKTMSKNQTTYIPDGFVQIPSLDGYYMNEEKKIWSNWDGGRYVKLSKIKGIYERYSLRKDKKQKWYTPDELFNMTFNK